MRPHSFPVYLSESLVFGAVETHALAASSEGGLTEVTAPESDNRQININARKRGNCTSSPV